MDWTKPSDGMPASGRKVLVAYKNDIGRLRRTCAHYAAKHTIDASVWDWDIGDPDVTEEGVYEPEGWYEEPVEIERVELIANEILYWQPLPPLPTD